MLPFKTVARRQNWRFLNPELYVLVLAAAVLLNASITALRHLAGATSSPSAGSEALG